MTSIQYRPFNPKTDINVASPLGSLVWEQELKHREQGTSQNKALAYVNTDDGLPPVLVYEDISIFI